MAPMLYSISSFRLGWVHDINVVKSGPKRTEVLLTKLNVVCYSMV